MENDANCFGLSEARVGARYWGRCSLRFVPGYRSGGRHRRLRPGDYGAQRDRREWGHDPLPWPTDGDYRAPSAIAAGVAVSRPFSRVRLARDHLCLTGASPRRRRSSSVARRATPVPRHGRALRGAPGPLPRPRDQYPRPRCHRAGRAACRMCAGSTRTCRPLGQIRLFRPCSKPPSCRRSMAIRAG